MNTKINTILSTIITLILFSTNSMANEKEANRIKNAFSILATISASSATYKVKPAEPKEMLLELGIKEAGIENEEDFNSSWVGQSDRAWEADSTLWGTDTIAGAHSYIKSSLEQALEESEKTEADKVKFADAILKAKRAFAILRSIKSVKFGVAPLGAVQCGVRFAALLILNTETGEIFEITMEGSGC